MAETNEIEKWVKGKPLWVCNSNGKWIKATYEVSEMTPLFLVLYRTGDLPGLGLGRALPQNVEPRDPSVAARARL